jgi:hypothetical protein
MLRARTSPIGRFLSFFGPKFWLLGLVPAFVPGRGPLGRPKRQPGERSPALYPRDMVGSYRNNQQEANVRNAPRLHAVGAAVAIAAVLGTGAGATAATSTGGDALIPHGPARVRVPYNRINAFRVKCAAVPCEIRLVQRFYVGMHPLGRLRDLLPGPIVMREQPPPACSLRRGTPGRTSISHC